MKIFKKSPESIFFMRGLAAGVILMSAAGTIGGFDPVEGLMRGGDFFSPDAAKSSPATEAADIITQALVLSDHMMNRSIEEKDISTIVTGALRALDPHSGYIDKETTDRITVGSDEADDKFMLGLFGEARDDGYFVRSTTPGGPSEGLGILSGDKLLSVGDVNLDGQPGSRAAEALRRSLDASMGNEMKVVFDRNGETYDVVISPQTLTKSYVFDMGVIDNKAHILVRSFFNGTHADVDDIIARSIAKFDVDGVVFDLRGNSGGLTEEARKTAELVLPKNTLLFTETGLHIEDTDLRTSVDPKYGNLSVAVLIDEYSASASEIFASAIQSNHLGPVVGEVSFGKGTIQNVYPFLDGRGAIKITVGEYRDALGRPINEIGVIPDHLVAAAPGQTQQNDPVLTKAIEAMEMFNG